MSVLSFCDMKYDEGKFMEAADRKVCLRHLCVYLPRARFHPLFLPLTRAHSHPLFVLLSISRALLYVFI